MSRSVDKCQKMRQKIKNMRERPLQETTTLVYDNSESDVSGFLIARNLK